jgi:hypothetical protein
MRILYLHGLGAQPGGAKATFLRQQGHEVVEPEVSARFSEALSTAQQAFDRQCPDAVVGASRGGAVAMNIDSGHVPLVLIAPAWKWRGRAKTVRPETIILHSPNDEVVPPEHSRELARRSRLAEDRLVMVGEDHRMSDEAALAALREAVEKVGK